MCVSVCDVCRWCCCVATQLYATARAMSTRMSPTAMVCIHLPDTLTPSLPDTLPDPCLHLPPPGDVIKGKVSRDEVAALCIALLGLPLASDTTFEIKSTVPFSTPWQVGAAVQQCQQVLGGCVPPPAACHTLLPGLYRLLPGLYRLLPGLYRLLPGLHNLPFTCRQPV